MLSTTRATLAGSTSGSVIFSMPNSENNVKKVIIYCNALVGTVTIPFARTFIYEPSPTISSPDLSTIIADVTTTQCDLDAPSATTGFLILEGF